MDKDRPHILYTGRFDENSPRGLTIRQGLEANGCVVFLVHIDHSVKYFWQASLKKKLDQFKEEIDIVILGDLSQELFPVVKAFAEKKKIPLLMDFFFSFYDSFVFDRKTISVNSMKANGYFKREKQALELANGVFFDTQIHKQYIEELFEVDIKKSLILPIGCPSHFYEEIDAHRLNDSNEFQILFWGSYIPLHGLEYVVEAATELQKNHPDIMVYIIGKQGQTYAQIRKMVDDKALSNVILLNKIPQKDLIKHIKACDLALGIFGKTEKADRVVPHKVYEALAVGVPILTKSSPAYFEVFDEELCYLCEPDGIADAIVQLKNDGEKRGALATRAQQVARERFTPEILGKSLKEFIQKF